MSYTDMTFEELVQSTVERFPSDVDKREGSVAFDAVAPCCYAIVQQNFRQNNFVDLVLADTAEAAYLDRSIIFSGISRKEATPAIRKMITSGAVEIGSRWGISDLVYRVTKRLSDTEYEVTCETSGVAGNLYSGAMQPMSNGITGITAELTDIVTAGTDRENDESLRSRFYVRVRRPASSGNQYQYEQWALEVPGVGATRVFPCGDGPGTVVVLVVDDDMGISSSLPQTVWNYIESVRPVGATVIVDSPTGVEINVSANVLLDGSQDLEAVKTNFEAAVKAYLKETVFTTYRISYARINALLLDVPGVADLEGLKLNSGTGNVALEERQIPVLGSISLVEVEALEAD